MKNYYSMSNYRNYNMKKTQTTTQFKAIFITLLVHFGLLAGLWYMNADNPTDSMPEFVQEWVNSEEATNAVASQKQLP